MPTRIASVRNLGRALRCPQRLPEFFAAYDCSVDAPAQVLPALDALLWAASQDQDKMRQQALAALVAIARAIVTGIRETSAGTASLSGDHAKGGQWSTAWTERQAQEAELRVDVAAFHRSPEAWLSTRLESGKKAAEVAQFLSLHRGALDAAKLGDFLGFHADCSEASCDIPEFYHKIMYLRLSVPDCWSKNIGKEHCADYYPTMKNANVTNSKTVTAALSKGRYGQQLLEIMRNPAFEQLQDPPTGVYVRRNTACPVLKANFSCMLYDEPESDEEAEEERREENQKREQELERKQELMRSAAFYPVATNFAALLFLVAGVEMCSA